MRSISGFNGSSINGSFASGEPISASALNKLAAGIDNAKTMPSNDLVFMGNTCGTAYSLPQQVGDVSGGLLQQFQIVIEPYDDGSGEPTNESLIRVVKGEVVWSPKLLQPDPLIPIPISSTCTAQTTIEDWYGGIPYVVEVDGNETYIGNGGLVVSNAPGAKIGVYIFKATLLPTDLDPIILAAPGYTPSCPVTFPGTPPVDSAFWEVVEVGNVQYTTPDPETGLGGWAITQKFIGSMTLPGDGKSSSAPNSTQLPGQLVYNPGSPVSVSPFECQIVNVNGNRYLQIAKGTAAYSSSNMPTIYNGAFTHTKQALFTKIQITSNPRVSESVIWPYGFPWDEPSYSLNMWMEDGGGYQLYDTNDQLTIYAFKWDSTTDILTSGTNPILSSGLPMLAMISDSNSTDQNKIVKDCGPSIYEQTMNVKPMSGYDAEHTEEPGDWGYCHTTYLNPRKLGYNYKAIAALTTTPNTFNCYSSIQQTAIPGVQNMVQHISLVGDVQSGVITFTCGSSEPSAVPFPAVSTIVPGGYGTVNSDELTLLACLNSIVTIPIGTESISLAGNVQVSKASATSYFVTFVNQLQGVDVPLLNPITTAVVPYAYSFKVIQYHTGMIDLTTPMQMGMTQLMNRADLTEADDPYYQNKDGSPNWKDICNKDDAINCTGFAGDFTTTGVYSMSGFTNNDPSFYIAGSCGDSCDFPFQVHRVEDGVWSVCTGMVNNEIPTNINSNVEISSGYIYLAVHYNSDTKTFPAASGVSIAHGSSIPDSTKSVSYVGIAQIVDGTANQLVTGSLWGDRIQVGSGDTENAFYYYAQV